MPDKQLSAQEDTWTYSNGILAALPSEELERVRPFLEHQQLARHAVLCDPEAPINYGYFLNSGMASCLIPTSTGRNVEVALVGKGGFVGNPLLFGVERSLLLIIVQVSGDAYRIKSQQFRRLLPNTPHLFQLVGRQALLQGMQAAQTAACNRLHTLEQRLARWLLMTYGLVGSEFPMTQEYLAQMLGTGRPSVSLTASQMQRAGLIRYARGLVRVVDREGLEKLSCECHAAIRTMSKELQLN